MPSLSIGCTSTSVYVREATDGWIFLWSYLDFSYVRTGSNDSIYDTSIIEVVDIPCRNSPYYMGYSLTWIFEPSVYIEWLWDRVTSLCRLLLRRLASSIESHHFSWDVDPANTMAYCTVCPNFLQVSELPLLPPPPPPPLLSAVALEHGR